MSKYILFAWNDYWPYGGQNDIFGVFDSGENAVSAFDSMIIKKGDGWYNILYVKKTEKGKEVKVYDLVHKAGVFSVDDQKTVMLWSCVDGWKPA